MIIRISQALLIFSILVVASCDRPECENMNVVLDQYEYDSNEYKNELADLVHAADTNSLSYWLHNYHEKAGKEYLGVYIQGGDICAKGEILVNDWDKIEGIRTSQGQGYRGAQLVGLTFDIQQNSGQTEFIYRDLEYIRD